MSGNMFSSCANFCISQAPQNNLLNSPKSQILQLLCDFDEICVCLLTIIEIKIYEYRPPYPPSPGGPSQLQKSQILHIWCDFDEN